MYLFEKYILRNLDFRFWTCPFCPSLEEKPVFTELAKDISITAEFKTIFPQSEHFFLYS